MGGFALPSLLGLVLGGSSGICWGAASLLNIFKKWWSGDDDDIAPESSAVTTSAPDITRIMIEWVLRQRNQRMLDS
jgi:hypothetical protein